MSQIEFLPIIALLTQLVTSQKLLVVITEGISGSDFYRFSGKPPFDTFENEGVWSTRVVPVFPTLPFPNRHTMLTGVLPKKHELIDEWMLNWKTGETFANFTQQSDFDAQKWWNVPPVYLSATRAGAKTALFFFPECFVEWSPQLTICIPPREPPSDEEADSIAASILQATKWADLTMVYDSWIGAEMADEGSLRGDSPALQRLANWLYRFSAAARERVDLNLIFVSMHGRIQVPKENVQILDNFVPMEMIEKTVGRGAILQIKATQGKTHQVYSLLNETNPIPNVKVFFTAPRAGNLPRFFHFRKSHLVADLLLLANPGYGIVVKNEEKRFPPSNSSSQLGKSLAGYNPHLPSMSGLFLAIGPAFRPSFRKGSIEICDIAALICSLVHVECPKVGCARIKRIDDILTSDARMEVRRAFQNASFSRRNGFSQYIITIFICLSLFHIIL
ncbi:unnamed protein product, partial [Mesorhabditis belari]|uniref:glycerophosphocholine cholinephosphodiesterase n=1 Tax=Mesorhabditis belari TaxID=2138241 RepID=A0AAF3FQZ8_9BILA